MAGFYDTILLEPCIATFGEVAKGYPVPVYTPAGGSPFALDGIFTDGFTEIDIFNGPPVATSRPILGTRIAAFPAGVIAQQDDEVTIRGQPYAVREVRPDSHGGVRLLLNMA